MRLPPFLPRPRGRRDPGAGDGARAGIASPRAPAFFRTATTPCSRSTPGSPLREQRLGPYSRFHFHHPGPALFYLSVPVYEATGKSHQGLKLAAPLQPPLRAWTVVARSRLAGLGGYLATALGLGAFVTGGDRRAPLELEPDGRGPPFGLALLAWGGVAAGHVILLPLAVFASSFAVQTHVAAHPSPWPWHHCWPSPPFPRSGVSCTCLPSAPAPGSVPAWPPASWPAFCGLCPWPKSWIPAGAT
jgi:hypothetical protein